METLRLRRIQEPSRVERLLEAYVSRSGNLPDDAYQVRDKTDLPESLHRVVARAIEQGQVWLCWARGSQIWLFTCHMSLGLSRERGAPVILLEVYDEKAELRDCATWRFDPRGEWTRCAD